jgi:hypothetical protein
MQSNTSMVGQCRILAGPSPSSTCRLPRSISWRRIEPDASVAGRSLGAPCQGHSLNDEPKDVRGIDHPAAPGSRPLPHLSVSFVGRPCAQPSPRQSSVWGVFQTALPHRGPRACSGPLSASSFPSEATGANPHLLGTRKEISRTPSPRFLPWAFPVIGVAMVVASVLLWSRDPGGESERTLIEEAPGPAIRPASLHGTPWGRGCAPSGWGLPRPFVLCWSLPPIWRAFVCFCPIYYSPSPDAPRFLFWQPSLPTFARLAHGEQCVSPPHSAHCPRQGSLCVG